jgi:pimeloyl-ACP methyl ester carboxylesterase
MKPTVVLLLAMLGTTQGRSVNVGDAVINYEVTGQGEVLVLIHGWAQDLTIWDDQVRDFSSRYRVLRFDRRGYGRSTGHADESADPDDLRILLDSLGIQKASVLGLSAGSDCALNFAVAFPDRVNKVVLYGQGPPAGFGEVMDPFPMFRALVQAHGLDSLGKLIRAHPLAWMPPNRPDLQELLVKQWSRYEGRDLLDPRPPSNRVPQARMEQLGAIRAPVLVIHGDHEMALFQQVADTLVRRIPGARREVIKDGGHGAHFAQPTVFNDVVLRFLAGPRTRE